jgi:hypothetical protein
MKNKLWGTKSRTEYTILVEEELGKVPMCSGNLESPVVDVAKFIGKIRYRVGGRLYIENAD